MDVSVRELKNHLSQYLRRVQAGEAVTVTLRGRRIARLVAETASRSADSDAEAVARLRAQPGIIASRKQGKVMGSACPISVPPGTTDEIMRWVRGG